MNENDNTFSIDEIESAYLKFKTSVYYDNTLLYYFKQIADFEDCPNYKEKLEYIVNVLNRGNSCEEFYDSISIIHAPKSIEENQTFSETSHKIHGCCVNKVLPIIDCSIELHILDTLLSMYLLKENDFLVSNDTSYSYSVNDKLFMDDQINLKCKTIFDSYIVNYNKWKADRNTAIRRNYKKEIIVFKIDIKSFYFNRDFLGEQTINYCKSSKSQYLYKIILNAIKKYNLIKNEFEEYEQTTTSLPVGLFSSKIFSEMFGLFLDGKLKPKNNCLFYGRYVDDICVVCKKKRNSGQIIEKYLPEYAIYRNIFSKEKELVLEIKSNEDISSGLSIMDSYSPSTADFMMINEQDQKNSSESYLFNIVNETTNISFNLKDVLNDYNHTLPFVNLNGENKITDFDRFLLTTINKVSAVRFFKTWPNILRYVLLRKNNALAKKLINNIEESINKLAINLKVERMDFGIKSYLNDILDISKDISKASIGAFNKFRKSLMYLQCGLIDEDNLDELKKYPRIIELWEISSKWIGEYDYNVIQNRYFEINGLSSSPFLEWNDEESKLRLLTKGKKPINPIISLTLHSFGVEEAEKTIDDEDYFNSFDYLNQIIKIFREARLYKTNYLVGHECFIPYRWKILIAYLCYKYRMSFIAGFQYHKTNSNEVANCVFDYEFFRSGSRPYLITNIREKFIYSPIEDALFGWRGLVQKKTYFKPLTIENHHIWHSTLLCYELTNISFRNYFIYNPERGIDLLFLPVLNRDTEYFNSLVFSYTRDAYLCIAESNTSFFKGTGIYMPYKTVLREVAAGHGGKNVRIIATAPLLKELIATKTNYYHDFAGFVTNCTHCPKRSSGCSSPNNCAKLKKKYGDAKAPTKKI